MTMRLTNSSTAVTWTRLFIWEYSSMCGKSLLTFSTFPSPRCPRSQVLVVTRCQCDHSSVAVCWHNNYSAAWHSNYPCNIFIIELIVNHSYAQLCQNDTTQHDMETHDECSDVTIDKTQCAGSDTICNDILSIDKLFCLHHLHNMIALSLFLVPAICQPENEYHMSKDLSFFSTRLKVICLFRVLFWFSHIVMVEWKNECLTGWAVLVPGSVWNIFKYHLTIKSILGMTVK